MLLIKIQYSFEGCEVNLKFVFYSLPITESSLASQKVNTHLSNQICA